MPTSSWYPAEDGATLGQPGSEQGTMLRDEEHALGARISLERGTRAAPFAITCGIYGWMLHTRFFSDQAEAESQFDQMKAALGIMLEAAEETAEVDGGRKKLFQGVDDFIKNFP